MALSGALPAIPGSSAFAVAATEPERCETRLTTPFVQVVNRAVEQSVLSLEEAEMLAESPAYVNPLATRTRESHNASYIDYFRVFGEQRISGPAWADIRKELKMLVAKRSGGASRVERARGETSSVISMKLVQSLNAGIHNVWRWRRLSDGRNLIFFVNTERKLEVRDLISGEDLWTGPDAIAQGSVGDIGETEKGFAEVRFAAADTPIQSVRLPSLKEIPNRLQPVQGAIPRRYYSSGHGADILIYENGMVYAVGETTALYIHERDLKFTGKVVPSVVGSSLLLMQKAHRSTMDNDFVQFIDGAWRPVNSAPIVAAKAADLEIHGLQLHDTRLAVAAYSRRGGNGAVMYTKPFRGTPEKPVVLQAKKKIVVDAQAFEMANKRVFLFVASTDGASSVIEVFEPGVSSRVLMTREYSNKDHFQFFERDGRLMLGLFGNESFEILTPLESNLPLHEQKISPQSAGMRVLLGAADDVYLAIDQDGLKVYELFGRGEKP